MKIKPVQKIIALTALALAVVVALSSCFGRTKEQTLYERIITTLEKMESFQTEAYVKYISNSKQNIYLTYQQARKSGEYRIEVTSPPEAAGNVTVFDGKLISQYNKKISGRISVGMTEALERSEILLTSFIKNYFEAKETSISVSNFDPEKETVLEAVIPGEHRYLATKKLWINNETLKPVELIIYDVDGVERIIVHYQNFEYNIQLDDSVFTVQD